MDILISGDLKYSSNYKVESSVEVKPLEII